MSELTEEPNDFYKQAVLQVYPDATARAWANGHSHVVIINELEISNGTDEATSWYYAYHALGLNRPGLKRLAQFEGELQQNWLGVYDLFVLKDGKLVGQNMGDTMWEHCGKKVRITIEEITREPILRKASKDVT